MRAFGNFATERKVAYVTKSQEENFQRHEEGVEAYRPQRVVQQAQAEGVMIPAFDKHKIMAIARRASDIMYARNRIRINAEYIASEIELVHDDIVYLRLDEMLNADAVNLMHDIVGIHQHLNIESDPPTFMDCFLPRFAAYRVSPDAA